MRYTFTFIGNISNNYAVVGTNLSFSTTAESFAQACSQINYQAKKQLGLDVKHSRLYLTGKLSAMMPEAVTVDVKKNQIRVPEHYIVPGLIPIGDVYTIRPVCGQAAILKKQLGEKFTVESYLAALLDLRNTTASIEARTNGGKHVHISAVDRTSIMVNGQTYEYDPNENVFWANGERYCDDYIIV